MFEALIQKLLKRIFGQFIDGLDSKKLHFGVWSGRLIIENVSLRKQLFEIYGLPYELLFSYIQKMTVQIPWQSISSSPVEIQLDSMLVLVASKPRKQWEDKGLKDVERLVTDLNSFIGNYLKRLVENEKTTAAASDKKGYLDNVYVRVLDNLQVAVRNIHVRYEDNLSRSYSFGVTLQSIEVFTTNQQGKRAFVDRTSQEKSKEALLKSVQLNNFGLYWKETETEFLHDDIKDQQKIVAFLQREIYKGGQGQVSPHYLLMINSRSLLKQRPAADLSAPRYELNFNLGELRVKLSRTVVQQLISFLEFKSEYTDRSVVASKPEDASRFKELFKRYYIGYESEKNELSKPERQEFERLLLQLKQEVVRAIAEAEVKVQYRNRIVTKMIGKKGNMLLEDADLTEIEQYMEKLARPNVDEAPLPPEYVYMHCGISFTCLSLFIVDEAQRSIFSITLQRIRAVVRLAQQLQNYSFEIGDIKSQGKDLKDILWKECSSQFLKAEYTQSSSRQRLFIKVSPVSLVYDRRTIDQLIEFSQVKVKTNLRNRAIDKVEELGVEVGKNIQRKQAVELDVTIDTPTLILLESRRRWVLEFGQFSLIKKDETALVRVANMKAICLTDSKQFECIPNFSISVAFNPAAMLASVEIGELRMRLDRAHFVSLSSLLKLIQKSRSKLEIMEKASRKSLVFLKEKNWRKVLATITEGYLYFWEKKEYPLAVVRIRKVLVGTDANRSNSIVIGDRRGNNYLVAFEDPSVMGQWLAELQKIASVQFEQEQPKPSEDKSFELRLRINNVQLSLLTPSNEQWLRVQIESIAIKHHQCSLQTGTQVSIQSLTIYSGEFRLLQRLQPAQLFDCELQTLSEKQPSSLKQGASNRLRLSPIEINYDPALVIRIFSFFQLQSDYTPPQQMFQDQTMQKMSQDRLLSLTEIVAEGVSVLLINKKTNQPLAKMTLRSLTARLSTYYYESVVQGSIQDMEISDLTNYPNTIYEEISKALVVPRMVFGSSALQQTDSILQFRLVSLQDGSTKLQEDRYETLSVRLRKARLVYMHEPVMRIVDYLKVQLKGVLQNPQIFDEYHQEEESGRRRPTDYREFIRKKQETISNRMLQSMGKERVRKLLAHPRELYLQVLIEQPELAILSTHGQGIQFKLESINFTNEFFYSDERVVTGSVKSVLCERYKLLFEDVTLGLLQNSRQISDQPFHINLSLDMFFKEAEYRFIAEEPLQLDTSLSVKMFVAPLYFTLSQAAALEILRVAKLNILHEDGLDFLMVHDYIPPEPNGLGVQLDFESITLTLEQQEQSMVEFDLEFIRYNYRKLVSQQSQSELTIASIQAKFLVDGQYRQMISRRRNLKMSTSRRNLSISAYQSSCIFEIPKKELPPSMCLNYREAKSRTGVSTRLTLVDNVMVFNSDFIHFLKQWAKLPQVEPLPKIFRKDNSTDKLRFSLTDFRTLQESRSLTLTRNLVSSVIPNSEKMLNCSFSAAYTDNSAKERLLVIEDMELFFCSISEISNEQFSSIKRRTFVGNFGLQCRINSSQAEDTVLLSLSRIIMKFSLKDIRMLAILADALKHKITKLTQESKSDNAVIQRPIQPQPKLKIGVTSRSFEIMLINDTASRYFPILYLNLEAIRDVEVSLVSQHLSLQADLRLFARYFNLKISVWEPLLESTELHFKYDHVLEEPVRSSLVVSAIQPQEYTTVDLSTNFVETLTKTLNDMELEFRSFEHSDWLNDSRNACVVVNNTGYPIECTCSGERFLIDNDSRYELTIRQLQAEQQMLIQATSTDIYLEVQIPLSRTHLRNINIKSEDVTRIVVTTRKKPTYLVKVVRVDISKNIRYVSLVSPVLLVNSTGVDLSLLIGQSTTTTPFLMGAVRSIPFDDVESTVRVVYEGMISDPISIFEGARQVKLGYYTLNVSETTKEQSRRITIESPYKLTSLLPQPLYMNLRTTASKFYSLVFPPFDPKQVVTHFFLQQIRSTCVSWFVEADNMLWTSYLPFAEGTVTLENMTSATFSINLQRIQKPEENSVNYVVYPSVVFLNKTEELLSLYYSNRQLIPGQTLHTENRSVISSGLQTLIIRSEGADMYSPPIKLGKQPKELILRMEKLADGEPVKVNCVVLLQYSPVSIYDIRFDKYTLNCQYRLLNCTPEQLLVRHANALMTETTKLNASGRSNLYWFSEDFEKEIRVTPNASNWEWSAPLNIERPELTHFILRDRSNYRKLLFMTLQVKLVQQQRTIELRMLTDPNQFPFLLINECEQVNVVIPALKSTLRAGAQTYFSWDDPAKQLYQVEVALQPSQPDNPFKERVLLLKEKRVENEIIELKASKGILRIELDVVTRFNQKIFRFRSYLPQTSMQLASDSHYQLSLKLAVCLINNTGRAVNLMSLYTHLTLQLVLGREEHKLLTLNCQEVQVDNNTKLYVYFPVVLKTGFCVTLSGKKDTWLELELEMSTITLRLEEDFVYELYSLFLLLQSFLPESPSQQSSFSISRVKLPKLVIQLQVQAKKLSIETPIELEKPAQTSYPWDNFPYPIKGIVLSLLSNLSISPISFISSLHEGVVNLFNESSSGRGVESFLTRIIGSIGSGINGMVRILVGDMERIDTFVDGVQSGTVACLRTTLSSLSPLYYEPNPIGLLKTAAGLVYKPITGILQFTLKLTEGIKNTAKFSFQVEDFETRKRYPVVFFGTERFYKEYDSLTAELVLILQQFQSGKYKDISLANVVFIREQGKEPSAIVLSGTHLHHLAFQSKRCLWTVPLSVIRQVRLRDEFSAVQLILSESVDGLSTRNPIVVVGDNRQARSLCESIEEAIRNTRMTS